MAEYAFEACKVCKDPIVYIPRRLFPGKWTHVLDGFTDPVFDNEDVSHDAEPNGTNVLCDPDALQTQIYERHQEEARAKLRDALATNKTVQAIQHAVDKGRQTVIPPHYVYDGVCMLCGLPYKKTRTKTVHTTTDGTVLDTGHAVVLGTIGDTMTDPFAYNDTVMIRGVNDEGVHGVWHYPALECRHKGCEVRVVVVREKARHVDPMGFPVRTDHEPKPALLDDEPTQSEEGMVNNPKHYTSHPSGVECITITRHYNFNVGNAMKYLWRSGLKDLTGDARASEIEDLKKAIWYIQDEIKRLEQ